jgi:SAM-dependent methyltransferase
MVLQNILVKDMFEEKISIPSVELLDQYRPIVNEFKILGRMLGHHAIGWSYYLEWAWAFGQIDPASLKDKMILDAGAGLGLSQWYLAEHGATVYSVDRISRACMPIYLRKRYSMTGIRSQDLLPMPLFLNPFNRSVETRERVHNLLRSFRGMLLKLPANKPPGKIYIYNQDLGHLVDIPDCSVDIVVSISSLEHNTPKNLDSVVDELLRVLRPYGALIATLAAAHEEDWFHTPSSSWCYTDKTLKQIFKFSADVPSNYGSFDELMNSIRGSKELKQSLSYHYFLGGKNGMPWGRWKPVYLPVGIVKVKK